MKRRYGITPEQYDTLLRSQNNTCAACQKPPPVGKPLLVDHCHDSGRVRALLCLPCNTALGGYELFREHAEHFFAKYGRGNSLLYGTD